jgi:hypothetical protein
MVFSLKLFVMLKILSSEVSADSDINYKPAVKFFACLGVRAYLILNENPHFATGSEG